MLKEYLENNLKTYLETDKEWTERFRQELLSLLENLKDDEESFAQKIEEIEYLCNCDTISFEEYMSIFSSLEMLAYVEYEDDYRRYETKIADIEEYIPKAIRILEYIPDGAKYTIEFSKKSKSMYVTTDLAVNDDNIEYFEKLNNCNNAYERYSKDEYDAEHMVIRVSDHDFGGNIYHSYVTPCISIVV